MLDNRLKIYKMLYSILQELEQIEMEYLQLVKQAGLDFMLDSETLFLKILDQYLVDHRKYTINCYWLIQTMRT